MKGAVYGVTPAPEYSACILVITEREGERESHRHEYVLGRKTKLLHSL
jgi:hypothetical protein